MEKKKRKTSYISKIVKNMPDSGIKDFFNVAATMPEALSLGIGEPDFETPDYIKEAGIRSIQGGSTKYTENPGMPVLRKEVANYLYEEFSQKYEEEEILITVGASEGIDLAMRACINPGDEVLIIEPSYVSYRPCVEMCGGIPVIIELKEENGFRLVKEELVEKITEKTKLLLLPFPNNPTGTIMEEKDLKELLVPIVENDILVLSDEIYAELTYGRKHTSISTLPGMKERTIVLNGFSKAFAMTGWRLGIAAGPYEIIEAMNKIHQFVIMSSGTISQFAGLEALKNPKRKEAVKYMRDIYDCRRKLIYEGFYEMGLDVVEPLGAFYVFPSIKKTGLTSHNFSMRLLEKEKVAVIPGSAFGPCGEGYIRCSYAYSEDTIKECLKRIKNFL